METVTHSLELPVPPAAVRECIQADIPGFIEASGFDSIEVDGDHITVSRSIGLATLELTLAVVESDAVLALEQREGIFDHMWTEYRVEEREGGSRITATTDFTLGNVLGPVLDSSVIATQRRSEFEDQFEYLAAALPAEA